MLLPGSIAISGSLWAFGTLLDTDTPIAWVAALYGVLNIGIAFMMPTATSTALGALAPRLYSHGSTTISTLQPLASAVATALFISTMTTTQTSRLVDGAAAHVATGAGTRTAFLLAGALSLISILMVFLLRRPNSQR